MEANKQNIGNFHFGQMLKRYIDRKRVAKSELARVIGVKDPQIIAYQYQASPQLGVVLQLSHALKHNFFMDIAATLPTAYTTDVVPDTSKDDRIAALELENTILKAEKAVLLLRG